MTSVTITRWQCDRCESRHTEPAGREEVPEGWLHLSTSIGLKADLCAACVQALALFMLNDGATTQNESTGTKAPTDDELARRWIAGDAVVDIAKDLGLSVSRVYQMRNALDLPRRPRGRPPRNDSTRRFANGGPLKRMASIPPGRPMRLADDHAAIVESRTLFPTRVFDVADSPRLLVSGSNQRKIGEKVTKGIWRGKPIYCLTLEERASCPSSCSMWNDCYGNHMHAARRHKHGPELIERLRAELIERSQLHAETGFVVRLHILGDFWSIEYVVFWQEALRQLPGLHVFGFTAHHVDTAIGEAILHMNVDQPLRCRIRFSDTTDGGGMSSHVIETVDDVREGSTVCPAQTGATDCCGTCGLCWTGKKPIAFARH